MRPGKPRTIDDERVAELIKTTLHTKPADGSTHWTARAVAAETSISSTSVHRYWVSLVGGVFMHLAAAAAVRGWPFWNV
ncbi:hypothetical protein CS8_080950 [Cupriavidus sp. 8B]